MFSWGGARIHDLPVKSLWQAVLQTELLQDCKKFNLMLLLEKSQNHTLTINYFQALLTFTELEMY